MQTQAKDGHPKPKRSRKARNVLTLAPDDPNYDTLAIRIEKRQRAREKRREEKAGRILSK